MKIENTITITVASVTLIKWVYEYVKQIHWTKNKYLVERIDSFKGRESTKVMEKILDWNAISVELEGETQLITDDILMGAFMTHNVKHKFSKKEAALRRVFDEYFDGLTEFVLLAEMDLIDLDHFKTYFKYWLNILSGRAGNKPEEVFILIKKYLEYYGYSDLSAMLNDFEIKGQ